jgi:hypothetical protein
LPLDFAVDAVAGDAGLVADDGAAGAGEAIEKGGLADVGDGRRWRSRAGDSIRQFLTFEQRLSREAHESRQLYFDGLEMLRAHIYRSLLQIARIADMEIPTIAPNMRYDPKWTLEAYQRPSSEQAAEKGLIGASHKAQG